MTNAIKLTAKKPRTKNYPTGLKPDGQNSFFLKHLQSCIIGLGQLFHKPLSSITTIIIIGIALALPFGFYILLQNVRSVSNQWDKGTQITLYLKKNTSTNRTQELLNQLQTNQNIVSVKYISPEDGLKEFQETSGFGNILSEFSENPLPGVILVQPQIALQSEANIAQLVATLEKLPEVDSAKLDENWIKRLYYLIDLSEHLVSALLLLFGIGVVLIISNTVRLSTQVSLKEIHNSKFANLDEIMLHRSQLYTGIWYGIFGSAFACLVIQLVIWWLQNPVHNLAYTYGSDFILQGITFRDCVILLFSGTILGLISSWLAVLRHLRNS